MPKNVCVVVLGDLGRSPRMQYHALSLAEMGHKVDVIGYGETAPMEEVKKAPLLFYHYLIECPRIPHKLLNYLVKTIWQAISLLFVLGIVRRADVLIVQNPPAIPSLLVCWVYCRIVGSKFVIDWHNYTHTIMALTLGEKNILVKISRGIEAFFGRRADRNFCVTNAMRDDLYQNWAISATTLYDRPPLQFKPISLEERHSFLYALGETYKFLRRGDSTIISEKVNDKIQLRPSRPGILVSSTSWTEDEDFSVLLSALQNYEDHISGGNQRKLPDLYCFITGKGHLKEYYCKKIALQDWKHVVVVTPWLKMEDYPFMLASADLGVCLHTSSSGLDLPMKVVDMFGCHLPVCAYKFKCLDELVKHGQNGYHFNTSEELSSQLQGWFEGFPNNEKQNEIAGSFRNELEKFQRLRWQENWTNVASPAFQ